MTNSELVRSRFADASADFVAGWVSGVAGVLVSHPIDTVKVRLQTQGVDPKSTVRYNGMWHCVVETIKREQIRGFFKGISSPLLGTAAWNAVVFGAYGNSLRYLAGGDRVAMHDYGNQALAGVVAGVAQTFVICPLELTKTRLQIQSSADLAKYRGLWDCIVKIWNANGLRGLYKGVHATLWRDLVGFPTYFVFFEFFCRLLSDRPSHDDLGPFALCLTGGLAGALSWGVVFPQDVIKCRLQVDYQNKYTGAWDCLAKSFREERWKLFSRGLAPTVIRGFPMNAAIFSVYIVMMRFYRDYHIGRTGYTL